MAETASRGSLWVTQQVVGGLFATPSEYAGVEVEAARESGAWSFGGRRDSSIR